MVDETLEGRGSRLKEARIGLDVFGRKADSYDPAIDPIVRVQMGRLRSKLRSYYAGQGAGELVRIDVPIGSYVPTFSFMTQSVDRLHTVQHGHTPPTFADDLRYRVLPVVNMSGDRRIGTSAMGSRRNSSTVLHRFHISESSHERRASSSRTRPGTFVKWAGCST